MHSSGTSLPYASILQGGRVYLNEKRNNVLKQFVSDIGGFSSQYGTDFSISYTASNLVGNPSVFPIYGDFAQTFALRTYGTWWLDVGAAPKVFPVPLPRHRVVQSRDFVELIFQHKVYPKEIEIYETYNPGAVVRILAYCKEKNRWKELWTGQPEKLSPDSRQFSPSLKPVHFATNRIRLEFYHMHLNYYYELDAVLLVGIPKTVPVPNLISFTSTVPDSSHKEETSKVQQKSPFYLLPNEVLTLIFSHLDLLSLCVAARTCKLFSNLCYDPLFYSVLNLQPYWEKINDSALESLQKRCSVLKNLNFSWCGENGSINPDTFVKFIENTGENLSCICLSSCTFVNNECLKVIADVCSNLKELELRNCWSSLNRLGFLQITNLAKLVRLDLYRTQIEMFSLTAIIRSCTKLQYLFLGSCTSINNYDDIVLEIGTYLKNLVSLDLWRAKTLSAVGVKILAESCPQLMDLDLGWCPGVDTSTGCINDLIVGCPNLRKLFLTAVRTVNDRDLLVIANHGQNLQQLDILGSREITASGVLRILNQCTNLRLLDVSFCGEISANSVEEWRGMFPHVSIKRSFDELDNDGALYGP